MDGPAVLGWERLRRVEARYGLAPIHALLASAQADAIIADKPIAPLAHLILGMAEDAGRYVAQAGDREIARSESSGALMQLLEGLRVARLTQCDAAHGSEPTCEDEGIMPLRRAVIDSPTKEPCSSTTRRGAGTTSIRSSQRERAR